MAHSFIPHSEIPYICMCFQTIYYYYCYLLEQIAFLFTCNVSPHKNDLSPERNAKKAHKNKTKSVHTR